MVPSFALSPMVDTVAFNALVESLADAVLAVDEAGQIVLANAAAVELFGHPREALLGQPVEILMPHAARGCHVAHRATYDADPAHLGMSTRRSFSGLRCDGSVFEAQITVSPAQLAGAPATVAVVRDVTALIQREQQSERQVFVLDALNQIAALTLDNADLHDSVCEILAKLEATGIVDFAAFVHIDPVSGDGVVLGRSPRALQLAETEGMTNILNLNLAAMGLWVNGEVRGRYVPDTHVEPRLTAPVLRRAGVRSTVAVPCQRRSTDTAVGLLLASKFAVNGFDDHERLFLRTLGQQLALALAHRQAIGELRAKNEELVAAQEAALQQARLRALGEMAAGVVHDINNSVGPIIGLADLVLAESEKLEPSVREAFEVTRVAAQDISEVAKRMRTFFRRRTDDENLVQVNANDVVNDAVKLARARLRDIPDRSGGHLELRLELSTDSPEFYGVESEIREAVLNLLFNAADAMPQGGQLVVRTARRRPGHAPSQDALVTSAKAMATCESIWIEVADTGTGMDAVTRLRCIEPFFSTKGDGGSGLGLATVFGTVRRHEGTLDILSSPGRGTTFGIGLPVRFPADRGTPAVARTANLGTRHRLRVLHVDDERLMRLTVQRMLESMGHEITSVASGQEGLDAVVRSTAANEPFDVVVTDLGMPVLNGAQLARQLRVLAPDLPVVLLTGWDEAVSDDDAEPMCVDATLHKPVSLPELRSALAAVTDGASAQVRPR